MPVYKYTAIDKSGNRKNGEAEAGDERSLRATLRQSGFNLLTASKKSGGKSKVVGKKGSTSKKKVGGLFAKVTTKEIALFSRQMSTMTSSGVSLLKAMNVLSEQNENPRFMSILTQIRDDITTGIALSAAMAKHPKEFNKLFVSMIKAGEASGALDVVLERLADTQEKDQALRGKVKGAMMYPIIVLSVALLIVVGLLAFVVPVFTKMFEDAGMKLPGLTQVVVDVSDFLKSFWWLVIMAVGGMIFGLKKYAETEKGRWNVDKYSLKVPLFGSFKRKVAVGRFTRTMATLLDSGVPILTAFDIVADTVGNVIVAKAITDAKGSIKEGNTIAEPLAESEQFPAMVTQMIQIGEESGAIAEMLSKVADFNEREVEEAVSALVAAMEPMAIVLMAVMVGFIVVAMFLPMFKMGDIASAGA